MSRLVTVLALALLLGGLSASIGLTQPNEDTFNSNSGSDSGRDSGGYDRYGRGIGRTEPSVQGEDSTCDYRGIAALDRVRPHEVVPLSVATNDLDHGRYHTCIPCHGQAYCWRSVYGGDDAQDRPDFDADRYEGGGGTADLLARGSGADRGGFDEPGGTRNRRPGTEDLLARGGDPDRGRFDEPGQNRDRRPADPGLASRGRSTDQIVQNVIDSVLGDEDRRGSNVAPRQTTPERVAIEQVLQKVVDSVLGRGQSDRRGVNRGRGPNTVERAALEEVLTKVANSVLGRD